MFSAGCGKNAQPESIYCSVECIMAHASRATTGKANPKETSPNENEEESPPPLEEVADDDEDMDEYEAPIVRVIKRNITLLNIARKPFFKIKEVRYVSLLQHSVDKKDKNAVNEKKSWQNSIL